MKTIRTLLLAFLCLTFLVSCENEIIEPAVDDLTPIEKGRKLGPDKILIQAKFSTFHCAPQGPGCVCQYGSGNSPGLGDFEVLWNFCGTSLNPDGSVNYEMTEDEAYIMANGQKYFIRGSGTVYPVGHPKYDGYFYDEFEFYKDGDGNEISGYLKLNSNVYDIATAEQETKHIMHGFIQL